jgi:imidazolonepropionase
VTTLVVRGIGQLCTCDPLHGPAPGVITDAALVAEDGRLTYAGPEAEMEPASGGSDITEIDAGGAAVIPGLVDAHTHLVWLGDRHEEYARRAAGESYEEIAESGGGIRATVRATAAGTAGQLFEAARERARRMLACGTTTVEVKSGYGLEHHAEMRQLDTAVRLADDPEVPDTVATYLPLHALPDGDRTAFLDEVCTTGVSGAAKRARFVDAFCDTGAYTVAECARLFRAAGPHKLRAKVHADQLSRTGGALLAARSGAVSADHLERAGDGDLQALARAGVVGVLLPGAALTLGGPPPPGRRLLDANARIAIATDCNPGTCYSESMPLMMSLAVAGAGITPAEALTAATTGGAAALDLSDRGMLRPGLRCDAVILESRSWVDLMYHLGAAPVRSVIVSGRVVR